jgi:hypothetical protein
MTAEHICCMVFGALVEAMTFALGLIVGASMRRKEPFCEKAARSRAGGSDPD